MHNVGIAIQQMIKYTFLIWLDSKAVISYAFAKSDFRSKQFLQFNFFRSYPCMKLAK